MATEEYQVGYEAGYQDGWNAAQKPFVGLTDEERWVIFEKNQTINAVINAIEAKLKEKNNG
jgi:hypothetical protein